MEYLERLAKWARGRNKSIAKPPPDDLETETESKERWISIYVIYFTMFLISLGFSIIVTGVWPYLDKLDPSAGKEFMGYVVAANPLGQMLFSPLVGWWANKLGSIRIPLLVSLALFTFSSAIYSALEVFVEYRKYWMLLSRFLVGVSSANIAACRSYLSAATRFSERTKAVSMISLAQVLGFIIGPALQAIVVPLGNDGVWLLPGKLKLNMYTASGWINVFLSIINFCLFLPFIFKEHRIAAREAMLKQGKDTEEETWKQQKLDYLSTWTLLVAFFVIVFNFMLLETLGTPLTMDQFAWTKAEALYYMGVLMSVGAIIACLTFVAINPLCRMFPEAKVMLWGGFLFMVLGRAVYIPWGSTTPQMYDDSEKFNFSSNSSACDFLNIANQTSATLKFNMSNELDNVNSVVLNNTDIFADIVNNTDKHSLTNKSVILKFCDNKTELVGCPSSQEWCTYTPVMTIFQFLLGYALTALGYPIGVTLIQTIFSKVLGPRPQGVWMGLMTGSGCLSRVLGPVFVTFIYTEFGTIWTFSMTTVMMVVSMVWLYLFLDRLVPFEEKLELTAEATELQELNNFVAVPLDESK